MSSPLHNDCVEKVLALGKGEAVNRGFLDLFHAMTNDCSIRGLPSATLVIPMYDENSGFQPDDWAAEIHLVVRQVESVDDSDSDEPADKE